MFLAGTAALTACAVMPARAAPDRPALSVEAGDYLLGGWELYSSRFVTPEGRVVDDDNGSISHSEGQGYGMLLAVAAGDRDRFQRIWTWTEQELFVRDDDLAAWRWDPNATPRVTDRNDATDGDILIAWALLRAAERWGEAEWRHRARSIADAVAERATQAAGKLTILMPGVTGFSAGEQPDGPVVNLSYWVFPAIEQLETISPSLAEAKLRESGLELARLARFGRDALPTDWISLAARKPAPAKSFAPVFGYNAVRVPLYLAWEGEAGRALLEPYLDAWAGENGAGPHVVDVENDLRADRLDAPGYEAISDLVACALTQRPASDRTRNFVPTTYYPSTLHLLSLMAFAERYPRCL
ncbi:glycosyl hydrolase family 8 [Aureimonas sp. AU4]|uniref:glycosyl hydrolase family 8 n=1 Tax=Aureimonas sp. AU4 TaxID=1638163 RepID=UPI00078222A5|nr:glycosyl hydrolase family 8 [Aureimonas sp. AU4]